jgi:hypothetical protein
MQGISSEKQSDRLLTGAILFTSRRITGMARLFMILPRGCEDDTISWTESGKKTSKLVCQKFSQVVANLYCKISFDCIDFIPYAPDENYTSKGYLFNIFTRFKALLIDTENFSPIEPLLAHLHDVLVAGRNDLFEYLANWLAQIIQKLQEKLGTAIVFQAEQGCGKNIFTDFIISHLIGSKLAFTINDIKQITDRFNVVMKNKPLTVCDEMGNFGRCYKTNDKLKSLITQAKQNIECKGIDTITIHNYNNYIMQSNNPWPVRVEASDRRLYVVIACSKHKIADYEYFNALASTLMAENANLLLTWSARRDLTR